MASIIRPSSSEDIDKLAFSNRSELAAGPHRVAANDEINLSSENTRQLELDSADVERTEQRFAAARPLVEIHHHVDVASFASRITRDRAEQVSVRNAKFSKLLAMLVQAANDFITAHRAILA